MSTGLKAKNLSNTYNIEKAGKYVVVAMAFSNYYDDNGSSYGELNIYINGKTPSNIASLNQRGNKRQGLGYVTTVYDLKPGDVIKVTSDGQQGVSTSLIYLEY